MIDLMDKNLLVCPTMTTTLRFLFLYFGIGISTSEHFSLQIFTFEHFSVEISTSDNFSIAISTSEHFPLKSLLLSTLL